MISVGQSKTKESSIKIYRNRKVKKKENLLENANMKMYSLNAVYTRTTVCIWPTLHLPIIYNLYH